MPPSKKLALLAMCDWSSDDGGSLYPSIAKLAERLSLSERQTQRVLHELIDDGFITIVDNRKPGGARHYQINVQKLAAASGGDGDMQQANTGRVTPTSGVTPMTQTGDTDVRGGVTPMTQTGDTDVTLSVIYPSNKPSDDPSIDKRTRARARAKAADVECPADVDQQVFADWLQVRKAKRAGPVTPTVIAGLRREAAKAGISLQDAIAYCCLSGWQGFRAEWYLRQNTSRVVSQPDYRNGRWSRIDTYAAQAAAARGDVSYGYATTIIDVGS